MLIPLNKIYSKNPVDLDMALDWYIPTPLIDNLKPGIFVDLPTWNSSCTTKSVLTFTVCGARIISDAFEWYNGFWWLGSLRPQVTGMMVLAM